MRSLGLVMVVVGLAGCSVIDALGGGSSSSDASLAVDAAGLDGSVGPPIGLSLVLVAEVVSTRTEWNRTDPAPTGAFTLIRFLDPDETSNLAYDGRDAAGYGCVVMVESTPVRALGRDEGQVTIGNNSGAVFPTCSLMDGDYLCAESRTSPPVDITVRDQDDARVQVTIPGAQPAFSSADVGYHLRLDGVVRAIVAEGTAEEVYAFDPFVDSTLAIAATEHQVILGLGPPPGGIDVFTAGDSLSVSKLNGARVSSFDLSVDVPAGGFRLDEVSANPHTLPLDGTAARFGCTGLNGDCGSGSYTIIIGHATASMGPARPGSTLMGTNDDSVSFFQCVFSGQDDVEIGAAAMAAIQATSPSRVMTAVIRADGSVIRNSDGSEPTLVATGFGYVGWTDSTEVGEACSAVDQDCSPDQRCTSRLVDATNRTRSLECSATGPMQLGQACTSPQEDDTTDDCARGAFCAFGTCRSICDPEDFPCGAAESCVGFGGLDLAACLTNCDVLNPTTCDEGESCYFRSVTDSPTCAKPSDSAPGEGEQCQLGSLNACRDGLSCFTNGSSATCRRIRAHDPACWDQDTDLPLSCGCGGCTADELLFPLGPITVPEHAACWSVAEVNDFGAVQCDCGADPVCTTL